RLQTSLQFDLKTVAEAYGDAEEFTNCLATYTVGHSGKLKLFHYDLRKVIQVGGIFSMFWKGTVFMMDAICFKNVVQQIVVILMAILVGALSGVGEDESSWQDLAAQINQLVPFILGMYVSLSLARWWALRERALGGIFQALSDVCMLMADACVLAEYRPLHDQLAKFGLASVELVIKAARGIEKIDDLEIKKFLTAEEVELLTTLTPKQRAIAVWSWIARTCRMGFEGLPPPNFNIVQQRCIMATQSIQLIDMYLCTQLPFAYVHLLTWLVHVQNVVVALNAGLAISQYWDKDVQKCLMEIIMALVVCLIYQGLLSISYVIEDPFGDDLMDFPVMAYTSNIASTLHAVQSAQISCPAVHRLERALESAKVTQELDTQGLEKPGVLGAEPNGGPTQRRTSWADVPEKVADEPPPAEPPPAATSEAPGSAADRPPAAPEAQARGEHPQRGRGTAKIPGTPRSEGAPWSPSKGGEHRAHVPGSAKMFSPSEMVAFGPLPLTEKGLPRVLAGHWFLTPPDADVAVPLAISAVSSRLRSSDRSPAAMKGGGSVEAALRRVARNLGRRPEDVSPHIEQLRQNWYDDVASLATVTQDDLLAIGLPLRIAKELLREISGDGGHDFDIPRRKGKDKDKGKEKGKDKDKGKDKGKGKDKDKGKRGESFDAFGPIKAARPSKGKGKGKKGADDAAARVHEIPIATDGVEEDFPWKDRILGERRRNADHVQRETGVKVWLTGKGTGDSDAPLTLSITASGAVGDTEFDKAVEMCEDLLEHIYEEAAGWAGADEDAEPGKGAKGKGKSKKGKSDGKGKDKGKEKGKGKRSWHDEEGPEQKRRR
ncbi:unnamed protein product, partial [Prorocentrum cordatum]